MRLKMENLNSLINEAKKFLEEKIKHEKEDY